MVCCSLKNKNVLITSGPTWVAIDDVRVISNRSTGEMGRALARAFQKVGARVTLLEGPISFEELERRLEKELRKNYQVVVHAAAVSDYQLKRPFPSKLSSHKRNLSLTLKPTKKIIQSIKKINPKVFLVGFKLEPRLTKSKVKGLTKDLFKKAGCDLVVANKVNGKSYQGFMVSPQFEILNQSYSRMNMAKALVREIKSRL